MKRIFAVMCLVLCSSVITADEMTLQKFFGQNPEYVKVQNELKELEKKRKDLEKSVLPEVDKETLKKDPVLRKKQRKMESALYRTPEYQRLYFEHDIKDFELKILESQFCLSAEDPVILALIKEQYVEEQKDSKPEKDISELPKKEIPGSPEFQHAMYVLDKFKEEGLEKKEIYRATRLADDGLEYNLRKAAFNDPKWRKFYYESKYTTSKYWKRYQELRLENIDLLIQQFAAEKIKEEYLEMEEEYRRIYNELEDKEKADPIYKELKIKMEEKEKAELIYQELKNELEEKEKADPILQKLGEEKSRVDRKWPVWDSFTRRSQLPEAVEYRQFHEAREAILHADEFAYQTFLEQSPEYVKLQNEMDELEAKRRDVIKSFLPGYNEDSYLEDSNSGKKYNEIRPLLDKSAEFQRFSLEYQIKHTEQKMLEIQLRAAIEDPFIFDFLKKRHSEMSFQGGIMNGLPDFRLPQKDVPGSPEFRNAMYELDEIKIKYRDDKENCIWRTTRLKNVLLHNVRRASFEDSACREAYYAREYARLALSKYSHELELANMDLWINNNTELFKTSRQSTGEMAAKKKADPLYQKLTEEKEQAELNEVQVLENFAQNSDLPEAKEYREFNAAVKAAFQL